MLKPSLLRQAVVLQTRPTSLALQNISSLGTIKPILHHPASAILVRTDRRLIHSTSRKMGVHNIQSVDDFEAIKKEHPLVVIDAFATWCGPCKVIAPTIVKWSNLDEMKGVFFAKFDVEELPKLSEKLGVRAMPTFIIFKNGEKDGEFVGANPDGLLKLITKKVAELGPVAPEAAPAATETKPATDA